MIKNNEPVRYGGATTTIDSEIVLERRYTYHRLK